MIKQPNITQKLILRHKNKILILRHKNGAYDFPGGRLKWKEGLFEALKREIKEELNFGLEHEPRLFHVWNYIAKNNRRHSVMIYYIYELNKNIEIIPFEGIEAIWLNKKQMETTVRGHDFVKRMFRWKDKKTPYSIFYCD